MSKETHYVRYRDGGNATIPFELKIKLPPPKKRRIITKRDNLGRIVSSKVPYI